MKKQQETRGRHNMSEASSNLPQIYLKLPNFMGHDRIRFQIHFKVRKEKTDFNVGNKALKLDGLLFKKMQILKMI